jgi:hypothetical protein
MHVQYSGSETEGWSAQKFEYTAGTFLGTLGVVIKEKNDILRFLKTLVVLSLEPPSLVSLNVSKNNDLNDRVKEKQSKVSKIGVEISEAIFEIPKGEHIVA